MRRVAIAFLLSMLFAGGGADFLAADRPIVLSMNGETYWFPNLVDYDELEGLRSSEISARLGQDDWALWTPIRFGPSTVRTHGQLKILEAPSSEHLLGTDDRGRDVLARLIHGATTSMRLALMVFLLVLGGGLFIGCVQHRSWAAASMVVTNSLSALPGFLLVLIVAGLAGTSSLSLAAFALSLPHIAEATRLVRAQLERERAQPYCQAALALGIAPLSLWKRYLLPAALRPALLAAGLAAATAVLAEAGLSFLGFAAPAPTASWGELLRQAADHDLRYWLAIPAGLMVTLSSAAVLKLCQPSSKA